jgi:hypothetical protein
MLDQLKVWIYEQSPSLWENAVIATFIIFLVIVGVNWYANRFWVLVKYKDEPGAGFARQYVNANNPYEAIQMAKALYGHLLISESANYA